LLDLQAAACLKLLAAGVQVLWKQQSAAAALGLALLLAAAPPMPSELKADKNEQQSQQVLQPPEPHWQWHGKATQTPPHQHQQDLQQHLSWPLQLWLGLAIQQWPRHAAPSCQTRQEHHGQRLDLLLRPSLP
jgi:hypothetical protein